MDQSKINTLQKFPVRFTKVSGAGNDFILFDTFNHLIPFFEEETIQKLCERGTGIGADGILILAPSSLADFQLKYFNADGTSGMLCANGARCAIAYARNFFDIKEKKISIECCGQIFYGEILDENNVKFKLNNVTKTEFTNIIVNNAELKIFLVNTGAPHAVIPFEMLKTLGLVEGTFDDFSLEKIGAEIRNHSAFDPVGTNVNVISFNNSEVKIRSFEKGVEKETLACGTGITAAAIYLATVHNYRSPIEIIPKSGKKFIVEFEKNGKTFENIYLTGEAKIIYYGEIAEKLLND